MIASELVKGLWMYLAARTLIGINASLLSLLPGTGRPVREP